jgi:hypothetical protein
MKKILETQGNTFTTPEDERAYWESRGPLAKGNRGKTNQPVAKENRSSFLSVRLSGKELTQLRDLATRYNLGPSTFARQVLVTLIEKDAIQKNKNVQNEPETIIFDEIYDSLMAKTPQEFREKVMSLLLASIEGDLDNPSSILIDRSRMREWMEMSAKFMSLIAETINPGIKVITPFDSNYEKEKAAKENTST